MSNKLTLFYTNETGEYLYAVALQEHQECWITAFKTKEEAAAFIEREDWGIGISDNPCPNCGGHAWRVFNVIDDCIQIAPPEGYADCWDLYVDAHEGHLFLKGEYIDECAVCGITIT